MYAPNAVPTPGAYYAAGGPIIVNDEFIGLLKEIKLPTCAFELKIKYPWEEEVGPITEIPPAGTKIERQPPVTIDLPQEELPSATRDIETEIINLIKTIAGPYEFHLKMIEPSLDSPMYQHLNLEQIKLFIFRAIDKILETEFGELAFTFQELRKKTKEKLVDISYLLLHDYVVNAMEADGSRLRQMYFDETMAQKAPAAFRHLQQTQSPRKMYLLVNKGQQYSTI